jgi:CheY-like chemotaxis protein
VFRLRQRSIAHQKLIGHAQKIKSLWVKIRASRADILLMMERSSTARVSQRASTPCVAAKVLVVDDDPDFRALARRLLERAGMDVIEAEDGRCGQLKLLREVDAIIVDMVMPHQDGIATLCLLKDRFPHAKTVAISGVQESSLYLGISAQLGANAVLHKSNVGSLASLVRRLLDS